MKCPYCQNKIEVPELWEFFDCTSCGASLQLEDGKLKILKEPSENTSINSEPQQNAEGPTSRTSEDFSESPLTSSSHTPDEEISPLVEAASNAPLPSVENSPSFEESENLSNILDFENSSHQKNHFIYHLQISEISSKFLFDKVRHIVKSPRVKLDCPNQAENNTLVIKNLNAVQMVYLLRKLSPLSVGIHWQQKSTLQ